MPFNLKDELKEIIKGDVVDSPDDIHTHSTDASIFVVIPKVIVYPKDALDIQKLVRFVGNEKQDHPEFSLTARAAGTCMSGGSLSESIVVDTTRYMKKISPIKGKTITVEPGVMYRDMEKVTLSKGLILPSYTASKNLCAVGGMVANNSSGEKTLTYGATEQYVKKLNVIFADGEEYEVKALTEGELQEKMSLKTFEGKVYREIYELITRNKEVIEGARPKVSKNSAGYLLWNVYKDGVFDLTKLFSGSQGTLGIVTSITFELVPVKKHSRILILALKDLTHLGEIINEVVALKPECFESYDDHTFELAQKYMTEDAKAVLTEKGTAITLIAQFSSDSREEAIQKVKKAESTLKHLNVPMKVLKDEKQAESYWNIRRGSFNLLRKHVGGTHRVAPFIDDVIVNPDKLVEFLPKFQKLLDASGMVYTIAGHVGNGNFHVVPLVDMGAQSAPQAITDLAQQVFKLVFSYSGSMAGEHNDGIMRTPYLPLMFGERVCELFQATKTIFDPKNMFNPGKKVGGTLSYAVAHFAKKNSDDYYMIHKEHTELIHSVLVCVISAVLVWLFVWYTS